MSETKRCPACKGTRRSSIGATHCLGCAGEGVIERDDPAARDCFAANWHDDLTAGLAHPTLGHVSELPIENFPALASAAHEAAEGGRVFSLTERGRPVAEIVPPGTAGRLQALQDAEDARNIRAALASDSPGRRFGSVENMLAALADVQ